MKESTDKKIAELNLKFEQIIISKNKCLNFVHVANKWKIFQKCCENNYISPENPIGTCIEGDGFINLISDENIRYINCLKKDGYYGKY
uniref:Uncharacterized protein n=1 Tax=Meloidogyne hapla TaxID=6305 RepID=A0A1I8BU75_MELHA